MRWHMAILKPQYLELILSGQKRLECRLTRIPCPPFGRIGPGETVLLKQSSGPVSGQATVDKVEFLDNLTQADIRLIADRHNDQIMASHDYWTNRQDCRFCSLVWLKDVAHVEPYRIEKKGMQAWLTFEEPSATKRPPVTTEKDATTRESASTGD